MEARERAGRRVRDPRLGDAAHLARSSSACSTRGSLRGQLRAWTSEWKGVIPVSWHHLAMGQKNPRPVKDGECKVWALGDALNSNQKESTLAQAAAGGGEAEGKETCQGGEGGGFGDGGHGAVDQELGTAAVPGQRDGPTG